jgi:hypothetical protein
MKTIKLAVSWVIVISFAITFLVTISALVGRYRIEEKYLSKLFTALILEIVAAGFFLFYHPVSRAQPYTGEWRAIISWTNDFSRTLFNYGNKNPNFQPVNPRSEGFVFVYLSKSGSYAGFSNWKAQNGELALSQLVVILGDFKFCPDGRVKSIDLTTAFRKQLVPFSYAKYTRYRMEFYEVLDGRLRGKIILYGNRKEKEVGEVLLEQ